MRESATRKKGAEINKKRALGKDVMGWDQSYGGGGKNALKPWARTKGTTYHKLGRRELVKANVGLLRGTPLGESVTLTAVGKSGILVSQHMLERRRMRENESRDKKTP